MNLWSALQKIDVLSRGELIHCIQRIDQMCRDYDLGVRNYTPEKLRKYALPYRKRLEDMRQKFAAKLKERPLC